jgi:hypothetical protein
MGAVMLVVWICLALVTEVCVMADGTLITHALNVVVFVLAERSVAVDTNVTSTVWAGHRNGIEDWGEAVEWVDEAGILDAFGAVIPIWAVEALVTNAENRFITSVAESGMLDIATGSAKEFRSRG